MHLKMLRYVTCLGRLTEAQLDPALFREVEHHSAERFILCHTVKAFWWEAIKG